MTIPHLTPEQRDNARQLLGYYGYSGGYQPGSFTASLLRTWELADQWNRARLAQAFPDLGRAVALMHTHGAAALVAALDDNNREDGGSRADEEA